MYKMIAFDIDGTLVQHLTNELSDEINLMFKKLKEKGIIITLATGRDFVSIANIYKNSYVDYFIGANGSFIYDLKNNKYIFNSSISFTEFEEYNKNVLMKNIDEINNIVLSDSDKVFVFENKENKKNWFWEAFRNKFNSYESAKEKLDKNYFHLITLEHKLNSPIYLQTKKYFEKYNLPIDVQAYWPKGFFVANKGITKASSLKKLCNFLNIDIKEVIAFGDGENDIEMIKEVGLGIAMSNGTEELKKIADDVTIDVEDYGTKFFLEKMGII